MGDPAVATDAQRLQECWAALPVAKAEVDRLYARWEELEARRR
jgi:ATP-binding cassette subfamily F protein uup